MSEELEKKDLVVLGEEITTIPLVVEKDKTLIANIGVVKEFVSEFKKDAEDKVKNELDVDNLETYYKHMKKIKDNFATYRKGGLGSISSIPKAYTSFENGEWQDVLDFVSSEIERRREKDYLLADKNITIALNELLDAESEKVRSRFDRRVLDKDFSGTRTNVTAQLSVLSPQKEDEGNDKYEARKAKFVPKIQTPLRTAVQKLLERELKPIREAVALEELKETETKRFDVAINSLKINSNDIKALKDILLDLAKQSETVKELYPNIHEYCTTRLRNTYSQVKSNIKALESEAKRIEAEEKAKEAKEVDLPLLAEAELISNEIGNNANDKQWLDTKLQDINGLSDRLSFKENIQTLTSIKERLFAKLSLLELVVEQEEVQEDLTTPLDGNVVVEEPKIVTEQPQEYTFEFSMTVNGTQSEAMVKAKLLKEYALSIGVELQAI